MPRITSQKPMLQLERLLIQDNIVVKQGTCQKAKCFWRGLDYVQGKTDVVKLVFVSDLSGAYKGRSI